MLENGKIANKMAKEHISMLMALNMLENSKTTKGMAKAHLPM